MHRKHIVLFFSSFHFNQFERVFVYRIRSIRWAESKQDQLDRPTNQPTDRSIKFDSMFFSVAKHCLHCLKCLSFFALFVNKHKRSDCTAHFLFIEAKACIIRRFLISRKLACCRCYMCSVKNNVNEKKNLRRRVHFCS